MAKLYSKKNVRSKRTLPSNETISFLLNYSKALTIKKVGKITFEIIANWVSLWFILSHIVTVYNLFLQILILVLWEQVFFWTFYYLIILFYGILRRLILNIGDVLFYFVYLRFSVKTFLYLLYIGVKIHFCVSEIVNGAKSDSVFNAVWLIRSFFMCFLILFL